MKIDSIKDLIEKKGSKYQRYVTKKKINNFVKKVTAVAREGLEIYSSVKRKDYVSLGLGGLSAVGVVMDQFADENMDSETILREMGVEKVCATIDDFVRELIKQMNIPCKNFWEDKGDEDREEGHIEEYHIGDAKAYFLVSGKSRNYAEGVYVTNSKDFFKGMSSLIESNIGKYLILESTMKKNDWNRTLSMSPIFISDDVYINNNNVDENEIAREVKEFFEKGRNRSLLFYGPPGTGKTTLAVRLTKALNGKILVVDGSSLTSQRSSVLFRAIDVVDPTVILFDDLDRIHGISRLLGDIERLNREQGTRNRLFIATINNLAKIPGAMRRPGRFDQAIEFRAPDDDTRRKVLIAYAEQFKTSFSKEEVEPLVKITEGMTQAYLKEIIERSDIIGIDKIVKHIEDMKRVALFPDRSEQKNKSGESSEEIEDDYDEYYE